jgi:hypothetical protein
MVRPPCTQKGEREVVLRSSVKTEYSRTRGKQNPASPSHQEWWDITLVEGSVRPTEDSTMKRPTQPVSYKQEMWRQLAKYKVSALGINPNGIWRKNQREYAHILLSAIST